MAAYISDINSNIYCNIASSKHVRKGKYMAKEESPLLAHARRELSIVGLDREDADYGGAISKAVIELLEVFVKQRHSGFSAMQTLVIFSSLAQFEQLAPPSNDPDEWQEVTKEMLNNDDRIAGKRIWQSRRSPSIFSKDGGKNWIDFENNTQGKSITKEELDGIKHANEQEQETPSGSGSSEGGSETTIDGWVPPEPVPESSDPSVASKEHSDTSVARSQRQVPGKQSADVTSEGNRRTKGDKKKSSSNRKTNEKGGSK